MAGVLSELQLPDKLYFKIGEVSEILEVKPYVLRYWETEFKEIKPNRRKSQRLYDKSTIRLLNKIKYMLHNQNLTIAGAKKILKDEKSGESFQSTTHTDKALLREILNELKSMKEDL